MCAHALARHKVTQEEARAWAGTKWKDADFVFTSNIGTPLHPDDVSRLLPKILEEAKLLRSASMTCAIPAQVCCSLGVPAKLVQETLGHSSYQLTMDTYSHMIPALRNEVADRMDEIFPTAVSEAVKTSSTAVNCCISY